jgi:hypothetical protein
MHSPIEYLGPGGKRLPLSNTVEYDLPDLRRLDVRQFYNSKCPKSIIYKLTTDFYEAR